MMLLRTLILIWAFIIRAGYSQVLGTYGVSDFFEIEDPLYKPWEKNNTAAVWISLEGMDFRRLNSPFKLHLSELPEWLILDGNNIETLSLDAFKDWSANLTYLSLARNRISTINMAVINYLKNLQVLVLNNNPVKNNEAIDVLCNAMSLRSLYLESCLLSNFYLPPCTNRLTHLHLSNNQIRTFYSKTDSSLTHLYLYGNYIRYIKLSQLNSLVYLDLSKNLLTEIARRSGDNPIREAEKFMRGYATLLWTDSRKKLYLDGADALQYLILSNNQITSIEPEAFQDIDTLVLVNLNSNEISEIYPATFKNMIHMEKILLDRNQIETIHSGTFVNLPNLREISLKYNLIQEIDGDVFKQLNTTANNVRLFLDNNQIEKLAEGTFRGIKGLVHIGLGGNRIKTISSQAFVDLPNLRSIVIEYQSPVQSEEEAVGTVNGLIKSYAFYNLPNLISITIRGNSFTEIEAHAFHQLPELKTLDLSNNSLHEISFQAFDDVPNIEELNLEGNELLKTEPGTFPLHLKRLNLAWNLPREDFGALHVTDLHQLEELDISGVIQSFKADDLLTTSKKLKVTVERCNHR